MDFGTLAVVLAAGLIGPALATVRRFGPPIVVGQIVAGVVIGAGGFGWVDPTDPVLTGIAWIGFALLMFVVGTHLPLRDNRLRGALSTGGAVAVTAGAIAVVAGLSLASVVELHRPAILALLIATSSGAVALPVLHELGRTDRTAMVATAWIALADVATVLALPVVLATGGVEQAIAGGLIVCGTAAGLYLLARVLKTRSWIQRARTLSHERGWGLDLRVSLLALFVCAWLASRFGTSILIAGFAVGAVVALLGEPRRVADQLIGVGEGFAIPVFFVHLGTQLDLGALFGSAQALELAVVVAAAAIATHLIAGFVWRLPLGVGLLACAQLGVPSAVVSIGLSTDQITPPQGAAIVAAMFASFAACSLGGRLLGHHGPLTDAAAPSMRASKHPRAASA